MNIKILKIYTEILHKDIGFKKKENEELAVLRLMKNLLFTKIGTRIGNQSPFSGFPPK